MPDFHPINAPTLSSPINSTAQCRLRGTLVGLTWVSAQKKQVSAHGFCTCVCTTKTLGFCTWFCTCICTSKRFDLLGFQHENSGVSAAPQMDTKSLRKAGFCTWFLHHQHSVSAHAYAPAPASENCFSAEKNVDVSFYAAFLRSLLVDVKNPGVGEGNVRGVLDATIARMEENDSVQAVVTTPHPTDAKCIDTA